MALQPEFQLKEQFKRCIYTFSYIGAKEISKSKKKKNSFFLAFVLLKIVLPRRTRLLSWTQRNDG